MSRRLLVFALAWTGLAPSAGCLVPASRFHALENQNASLADRNHAQQAQLENLKVHCRDTEDRLLHAEQELAMLRVQPRR